MKDPAVSWDSDAPATEGETEAIEPFDARGMHRVYARSDQFGRHGIFNMDIWGTRDGRLLMRCWSRCEDIDGCSFEINGIDAAAIPQRDKKARFQESWIPKAVRNAYDRWIQGEI